MISPDNPKAHYGDWIFPILVIVILVIVASCGGIFYWYYNQQKSEFIPVYAELGIQQLPANIERQIHTQLARLSREACYRDAIAKLADALLKAGYPRESATSIRTFVKRCPNSEHLLPAAYDALDRIGDFAGALEVADQLVNVYPANATFRYRRGIAYDQTNDHLHALTDYMNTIQLARDPKHVSGDVFYKMSRVYEKLGRYCDGITPIETYIALDPADRRTPQTLKIIAEFAEKGNCDTHYASGTVRIPILGGTGVHSLTVDVNGVSGNFILDTGATFVSVTSQFASKARVSTQPGNQMIMKTVGGTALPEIKYANTIRVGRAEASGVVVAVLGDATNPFSSGADGLLGMSFLARFKLNVSQTGIELTPVPLR
jgi:clan AA aspartic protease (TIGR02281 family)